MTHTLKSRLIKSSAGFCSILALSGGVSLIHCQPALADDGPKQRTAKVAKSSVEVVIQAPREIVWKRLTDFDNYPKLFPRVKSCQVIKRESTAVYLESVLKPQMFVRQPTQHTINDLAGYPNVLRWRMIDGNFKSALGEWTLSPAADGKSCVARYSLEVDPGPAIPKPVASMVLTMVQKEIVQDVKKNIENEYSRSLIGQSKVSTLANNTGDRKSVTGSELVEKD